MQLPVACLPLPALVPFGLIDTVCLGPVFLIPGLSPLGWIDVVCRGPVFLLPGLMLFPWRQSLRVGSPPTAARGQ